MTQTLEAPAAPVSYGGRGEELATKWADKLRVAGYKVEIELHRREGVRSLLDGRLLTPTTVQTIMLVSNAGGTLAASWVSVMDGGRRTTRQLSTRFFDNSGECLLKTKREFAAKIQSMISGH
jgi:hypothetical protein